MSYIAISPNLPVSSGEIPAIDPQRIEEVRRKHALLAEYLQLKGYDALLLTDPANYAWLTGGAQNVCGATYERKAAILVTTDARVVLCNNIDSGQIFDREIVSLGFLIKERSWTEPRDVLLDDVCRGRCVASDTDRAGVVNVGEELQSFRLRCGDEEMQRLQELGRALTHAVEATGRNFEPGATEAEVAGHLAHRLYKRCIEPVRIQVMADGQSWRYRNWSYGEDRIERHVTIVATGRRHGLHATVARTVCLGLPPKDLEEAFGLAAVVQATGIYFSQPGWSVVDTWKRVARIYEKFEIPDEWQLAEQADISGYRLSEVRLTPQTPHCFESGQVVCWHPSVRSALVADTFLIRESGVENLSATEDWPTLTVVVKGAKIDRPGFLVREV